MDRKIVVSTIIDNQVSAAFPKLGIQVYKDFSELLEVVESTPIRTDKIYVTEDVTRYNPNLAFTSLVRLYESVFFKADEIVFITPFESENIERIEFLMKEGSLNNVTIVKGELQKEFILSVIRGEAENNKQSVKRKEVIRHRRSEYAKENINKSMFEDRELVKTETDNLAEIDNQPSEEVKLLPFTKNCEIIQLTGENEISRSIFTIILAQYVSGYGKTVLIDTDTVYFTMSYFLKQASIPCENIPIDLFYDNPLKLINKIKESEKRLICLTGTSDDKDKNFHIFSVINSIFSMLKKDVDYFLFETMLGNILPSFKTVAVMENNLISAIKTAYKTPKPNDFLYAAVDSSIDSIAVKNSSVLSSIVSEVLEKPTEVPIYKISDLKLEGGNCFDMHRYVKEQVN